MNEIHQDLSNHRTYLWIIMGTFIGIAVVMLTMRFINPKSMYNNANVSPLNQAQSGVGASNASPSYTKALQNPDKPYTDENGTVHPPIGVAPAPYDPTVKVVAPPVGGTGKAPVVPKVETPKAPIVPKTETPVAPKAPAVPPATN